MSKFLFVVLLVLIGVIFGLCLLYGVYKYLMWSLQKEFKCPVCNEEAIEMKWDRTKEATILFRCSCGNKWDVDLTDYE